MPPRQPTKPFDFAPETRRRYEKPTLLVGFDGTDSDGVVFLGSGDGGFGASLLVKSVESGLIAGFERIDFVPDHQGILRAFLDAAARAFGGRAHDAEAGPELPSARSLHRGAHAGAGV